MNPTAQNSHKFTQILSRVSLFQSIAHEAAALEQLAEIMTLAHFSKNHKLIEQGTSGQDFFILTTGEVAVYKQTPDQDFFKVAVLSAKNHASFGEGGLIQGEVRSATIISETAVECLILNQKDFVSFCQKSPQFALPIVTKLAQSIMARLNQTSQDLILLHQALMNEIRSN